MEFCLFSFLETLKISENSKKKKKFLALGVMTLLEKLMPARETPTHLVASKSLKKRTGRISAKATPQD